MGVLIKDMAMPTNCRECHLLAWGGSYVCMVSRTAMEASMIKARRKDCPLIEIPTPHGRLIDADEPMTKISTIMQEPDYQHNGEDWMVGLIMARDAIVDAPTVIEAEA